MQFSSIAPQQVSQLLDRMFALQRTSAWRREAALGRIRLVPAGALRDEYQVVAIALAGGAAVD